MKKLRILLAVLFLIVLILAGCGEMEVDNGSTVDEVETEEASETEIVEEDPIEELTMGGLWLDASEFYSGVKIGIENRAEELGITLNLLGGNSQGDSAVEAEQMQTLIGANVDAIIISAVSDTASIQLIQDAHEAGIPVVCYNTCIEESAAEEYVYTWVTGDHYEQGYGVGKAMGEYFVEIGNDSPKIGVVNCERYEVCQQRLEGFSAAMSELVPNYEIVDNQEALEVDKALEVATNMLTANPDIDAFYGEAGNMVAGAALAIEQEGLKGEVVIFGHDITPTTAELLIDGTILKYINAMIAENFGKTAFDFALDAINGKPSPGLIYNMTPTDFFWTDPDQAQQWLDTHQ